VKNNAKFSLSQSHVKSTVLDYGRWERSWSWFIGSNRGSGEK